MCGSCRLRSRRRRVTTPGELCEGVNILLLDRNTLDAPELGIELASALHKLYPEDFKIDRMPELLINQAAFDGDRSRTGSAADRAGLAGAAGGVCGVAGKVSVVQVKLLATSF